MKILNVSLNTLNAPKYQDKAVALQHFEPRFDKVSFGAKTSEELTLQKEAKDLSKEAYMTFAKGKNIQRQGKKYLEASSQILEKAKNIQENSIREYAEINYAFKYAKENKLKASADPFENTQTIYEKNSIEEYRGNNLLRKAIKTQDKIILFEYRKIPTRKVFDLNGRLLEYNENYKSPTKTSSTSDLRLLFDGDCLVTCDYGVVEKPFSVNIKKSYQFFLGEQLFKVLTNSKNAKNALDYADEEYVFNDDDELIACYKNVHKDDSKYKSYSEMFGFLDKEFAYAKDYNDTDEEIVSVGKIFICKNSKLQKAIVDLCGYGQLRTISKYFTYSQNERPQYCYLNHQKACSTFDLVDDIADDYDKLVYLG